MIMLAHRRFTARIRGLDRIWSVMTVRWGAREDASGRVWIKPLMDSILRGEIDETWAAWTVKETALTAKQNGMIPPAHNHERHRGIEKTS